MNPRALTIALIASLTLNVFTVAAAATLFVTRAHVEDRVEDQRRPPRGDGFRTAVDDLSPEVRDHIWPRLREAAIAARPDFEQARAARREAISLAGAADFDAEGVSTLLAGSREAEARGRARLEASAVELLATLSPQDRAALAPVILSRHTRALNRRRGHERGPPPPPPDEP